MEIGSPFFPVLLEEMEIWRYGNGPRWGWFSLVLSFAILLDRFFLMKTLSSIRSLGTKGRPVVQSFPFVLQIEGTSSSMMRATYVSLYLLLGLGLPISCQPTSCPGVVHDCGICRVVVKVVSVLNVSSLHAFTMPCLIAQYSISPVHRVNKPCLACRVLMYI